MVAKLIAIGGIDGGGGSTQCQLLYSWLKEDCGKRVMLTKEPSDGKIGILLREYLKDNKINKITDALLFAADRSEHINTIIKPALNDNIIVITDRYIESSLAYQTAQGIDVNWILEINREFLKPDITIILDLDPEEALKRKKKLIDKFENIQFLKKVRRIYLDHAKRWNYTVINANNDIETVHRDIRKEVKKLLK
ncbi:MAG: dTMP kinase [Candidatus Helarchaeota archaeon]